MAAQGKVPIIDLSSWWTGDVATKKNVAEQVRGLLSFHRLFLSDVVVVPHLTASFCSKTVSGV